MTIIEIIYVALVYMVIVVGGRHQDKEDERRYREFRARRLAERRRIE